MSTDSAHPWLGDGEVLLHVGVHKTGTTAVQNSLARARSALTRQGVVFPGTATSHFTAGLAAIGRRRGWANGGTVPHLSTWESLVADVGHLSTHKVVLSGESFCEADPPTASHIVEALGGSRVRVVVTVRPLEQLLPSTWQQYIKAGASLRYRDWLEDVARGPAAPAQRTPSFWIRNDHATQVDKWVAATAPNRVAVVIVDSSRRLGVLEDFEDLIGLERGTLELATDTPSNRGLSAEEAEMVRRFNERIDRQADYRLYDHIVRRGGFNAMVEGRRPGADEHSITVPGHIVTRMRDLGVAAATAIEASGVHVVGDLAMLVPATELSDDDPVTPEWVPIDAATLLLEGLATRSFTTATSGRFATRRALLSGADLVAGRRPSADSVPTLQHRVRRHVGRILRRLGLRR